ncbi:MAG: L-myo-inositol-1-phosphate synthase, partial [Nitrososphaerales archaeon]
LNKTSRAYAEAALQAGCSFINCTPSPIAGDPGLVSAFEDEELLVVGDDLMSQFGGTVFHKGVLEFMVGRGVKAVKSYQLDVGGGAETLNTIDEKNKAVKRDVKTSAIAVEVPYEMEIVTGTTEYVDYMGNDRTSYYWISGEGFLGSQIRVDIYLRSSDGPNAANILLDTVRSVQVSKERGRYGAPNEICAYGFKRPPTLIRLDEAYRRFSETYLQ